MAIPRVFAQADAPVSDPATPSAPASASPSECTCVPAGTVVQLELAEAVHSARRTSGEPFAFRVHGAIQVRGDNVIPAGTPGIGEVVHAARSRGGGKPGELLLAARHLQLGERRVRLRGLKLGGAGKDTAGAALAASFVIGPFALFVRGHEIEIPAGTVAEARLAEDVAAAIPASPASTPAPTTEE